MIRKIADVPAFSSALSTGLECNGCSRAGTGPCTMACRAGVLEESLIDAGLLVAGVTISPGAPARVGEQVVGADEILFEFDSTPTDAELDSALASFVMP